MNPIILSWSKIEVPQLILEFIKNKPLFILCKKVQKDVFINHISFFERILFYLFFWPQHAGILSVVPRPGIEPVPPAVEARSLNHWTAREVPERILLNNF